MVFTSLYAPFGRSFANKVDSFDTKVFETINLFLFAKILAAQDFSAKRHFGIVSLCALWITLLETATVTEYSEDAIALFCDDAAYLLYLRPGTADRYQFGICPCTKELLAEYTRQYPLQQPAKTTWIYDQNNLSAVRLDFPEGHLYMAATEYHDIEIQLSDKIYNPLDYNVLPCKEGKHMEFLKRKVGD